MTSSPRGGLNRRLQINTLQDQLSHALSQLSTESALRSDQRLSARASLISRVCQHPKLNTGNGILSTFLFEECGIVCAMSGWIPRSSESAS
eukprot:748962-Rhodomonas_salina.1